MWLSIVKHYICTIQDGRTIDGIEYEDKNIVTRHTIQFLSAAFLSDMNQRKIIVNSQNAMRLDSIHSMALASFFR